MTTSNRFLDQLNSRKKTEPTSEQPAQKNRFLAQIEGKQISEPSEGFGKGLARTALQVPLGLAKRHPLSYGTDIFKLLAEGGSQDVLAQLAESDPDFDRKIAESARQAAIQKLPTQSTIEEFIEKKTGAPLRPKNEAQKAIRFGSEAASFKPGGIPEKLAAGGVAAISKEGLEKAGVPAAISEPLAMILSGGVPTKSSTQVLKPSGLATRKFESVKAERKVSPSQHEKIVGEVEKDFQKKTSDILSGNKTFKELKEDPLLKSKVIEDTAKVKELAEEMKTPIDSTDFQRAFMKRTRERPTKGFYPSEFEKEFNSQSREAVKKFGVRTYKGEKFGKYITRGQSLEQFRKNNSELGELFESGKSGAVNRAKIEVKLEENRAIADVFREKFPDSEFTKLFEENNKKWTDLYDIENITESVDHLFKEGKINYKKASQILDDSSVERSFNKLLGKKGFSEFKQLTKDLLSTEKSMAYLKKARDAGAADIAHKFSLYSIPVVGKGLVALQSGGGLLNSFLNRALSKPELITEWNYAWKLLKEGKYVAAGKAIDKVNEEVKKHPRHENPK